MRHLRAFLAVVEHQSFRGAAEALWASQPALSRTIAQMERVVGKRLFDRSHHGVRLSEAGERFLPYAARAVAAVNDAMVSTASVESTLRVGFCWNALGEDTTPLIKQFEALHPGVRVELRRIDEVRYAGLEDGRSHVAILRGVPSDPGVEYVVLHEESRIAALPCGHPMSALPELTMDDLRHDPLVVNIISGTTSVSLWEGADEMSRPVISVRNLEEWLEAIAAGRGIGLSGASTSSLHPHPWVAYRPLLDAPPVPVVLCWDADRPHPLTSEFVDLAKSKYLCNATCAVGVPNSGVRTAFPSSVPRSTSDDGP